MRRSMRHRLFVFAVAGVLAAPLSFLGSFTPGLGAPVAAAKPAPKPAVTTSSQKALARIHPKLRRALAQAAPGKDMQVIVRIVKGTSLKPYATRSFTRKWIDPAGMTVAVVLAKPANILKIAALRGVVALQLPESLADEARQPLEGEPRGAARKALDHAIDYAVHRDR